jgi:hypothetical protein
MSTRGIKYNGTNYLRLFHPNDWKQKSLEDNIYFTIRDIFQNIDDFQFAMEANMFNDKLTNGVIYEERTSDFIYSNILNEDFSFVYKLSKWLSYICEYYFDFEEVVDETIDLDKYILFDEWISQFDILKELLDEKLNNFNFQYIAK